MEILVVLLLAGIFLVLLWALILGPIVTALFSGLEGFFKNLIKQLTKKDS